jgi:uncharacterized protein YkwD
MRRSFRTKAAFAAALAAGVAGLAAAGTAPSAPSSDGCGRGLDWPTPDTTLAARVLQLVNAHRRALHLRVLTVSAPLTRAAQWKASHMARYRYMRHNDPAPPVKRTVGTRLAACGYPTATASWGENIAFGFETPADVLRGWLHSRGHKRNIEYRAWTATGVGVATSPNGLVYWAQDFGSYAGPGTVRGR